MIDVLKYRTLTALTSLLIAVSFVGAYFYKRSTQGAAFQYSVDFTGGTQVMLRFDQSVSSTQLKEILEQGGWSGALIREFGEKEVLVRVQEFVNDATGLAERMREVLAKALPENKITVQQSETVGPGVGAELKSKSIRAVFFALIALLLYIMFVFRSSAFAIGAVVALAHDALVMLAFFLLLNRDISINVIGAILAVLGYSINDTIVIFSRIRENLKKMQGASLYEVVNTSINQTMKRTLLTSLSTTLAVGSMLVLGGEALRDFSLTLLIGIVFGTYSSIFIASPVMMLLYKDKGKRKLA